MDPFRLELRADPDCVGDVRAAARGYAERHGASEQTAADVALAVSEAVTNVVVHAYDGAPGDLRLVAQRIDDRILIAIEDDGHGLAPNPATQGLGLGLPLIARVAADFQVAPGPQGIGTRVLMTFPIGMTSDPKLTAIPVELRDPASPLL